MWKNFFDIVETYFVPILMVLTIIVLGSWFMGYFLNGFYGYKFDLASCWVGFSAICTGVLKYFIDSLLNSEKGKMPCKKDKDNEL